MGEWTGLDHTEVEARWPGDRPKWRSDPTFAPPGGETRLAVAARAMEVVRDLHHRLTDWGQDDRPVLLVAHGGTFLAQPPRSSTHRCRTTLHSPRSVDLLVPIHGVAAILHEADSDHSTPQQLAPASPRYPPIQPGYQWRVDIWNSTTHLGNDAF